MDSDEKTTKTEITGQLRVTTEKAPSPALEAIKPNKTTLTWIIVWCAFHLFALLMSYSKIEFFNDRGRPDTKSFWPFVDFYPQKDWSGTYGCYNVFTGKPCFYGIFNNYDWTEFAFYVGGAIVIYLLVRISNREEETIVNK